MRPASFTPLLRLAAAFGLGGLLVLAFAPFGQGWLALPLIAALLYLWQGTTRIGEAALTGYAFGLGLMGFGVFWLRISIDQFGGVAPPLGLVFTLLFIAVVAGYFALTGASLRWLAGHRDGPWLLWLAAPLAWLGSELLRAWLFTGFPWLSLGYSQIDLPLAGFAPLFGVFGIGALLVLSAGLLLTWRHGWSLPALALLWGTGILLDGIEWTRPAGAPVPVALVQGNVPQHEKWQPERFQPTIERYLSLSEQAPQARLLIWPETAIAAFDDAVEDSLLEPLEQRMRDAGRDLLTGIVVRRRDGRYYNALLVLGPSGRQAYFKRHLVPFGEYLPLAPMLDPLLDFLHIPMSDFSADPSVGPVLRLAGHPVGVDICYEDAFGHEVAEALPRAAWLINASNDAWFGDSLAPHQHLEIARMRARETGRWLLRATNTGISAVIDHRGRVRARSPQFAPAVLPAEVVPRYGATPYVRWRDAPLWLLAIFGGLWLRWRRDRVLQP